jgi:hypothetical protein
VVPGRDPLRDPHRQATFRRAVPAGVDRAARARPAAAAARAGPPHPGWAGGDLPPLPAPRSRATLPTRRSAGG